ncbi:glucokinase [Pseudovibrio sp. Tun.PSC04-5.I4]|uniref:glucokinase n=1 Tax=Pseudovibrio sp. Tun.PSC04-5.I4 TaxID=1798213 RepID=UPI000880DEEA|nr:glucokinase [Pseudovibrio sp. Tun.PSC04-5.I4]SDR18412.1 glucokinase [Pseudovibrio sp. Tun.PSC04-5.I4]
MLHTAPLTRTLPYPVLVADIGGTNARFALIEGPNSATILCGQESTNAHATIQDAIRAAVLDAGHAAPRSAVLAVAAPVSGDKIALTNASWVIEPPALIAELGLEQVVILNDFEAQGLALPSLTSMDLDQIGGGEAKSNTTKFVVGPGTGLGAGALIRSCGKWIPVPGEGGHVELGPLSPEEYRIWPFIERIGGRIGAEQILCGAGLVRMAKAVLQADRVDRTFEKPSDVPMAAEDGDEVAQKVMRLFCSALGRVAGDFALTNLAVGGVYLAGGIAPKISRWLHEGEFRAAFEAKAPHETIMRSIPTYIITHSSPALEGLAAYTRAPEDYLVELTGRSWHRESVKSSA